MVQMENEGMGYPVRVSAIFPSGEDGFVRWRNICSVMCDA